MHSLIDFRPQAPKHSGRCDQEEDSGSDSGRCGIRPRQPFPIIVSLKFNNLLARKQNLQLQQSLRLCLFLTQPMVQK